MNCRWLLPATLVLVVLCSCSRTPSAIPLTPADSIAIMEDNQRHRGEVEEFFRSDPNSPFLRDTTITFHDLNWFPINPSFCGHSILHRYDTPETVTVAGTKGELRRQLKYGYFTFVVPGDGGAPATITLNVYKFTPYDKQRYALYRNNLSTWFTDETTGRETYDVGRYIELGEEDPDPAHVYTIDLNKAFNPYCAYSALYSCAIPRREDHLNMALRVGEMTYH